jgi:hypothetical protein
MQLRQELQLATMIKTMTDVIMPAIPPEHSLAIEQSQLIVGMLSLMTKQSDVQYSFDCDELQRLIRVADKLERICANHSSARQALDQLFEKRAIASDVLRQCGAAPSELHHSVRGLRTAITQLTSQVIASSDRKQEVRGQTTKTILEFSREQCLRDRSLMQPQGWEKTPIPAIADLLHEGRATAETTAAVPLGGLV